MMFSNSFVSCSLCPSPWNIFPNASRLGVPTPGDPHEKGITDLVADVDGIWACGWDDGGDGSADQPYRLLLRNTGSGWELRSTPCGGCSNRPFEALAVNASGALFLGGAITGHSAVSIRRSHPQDTTSRAAG
jgi:hypothetical protein